MFYFMHFIFAIILASNNDNFLISKIHNFFFEHIIQRFIVNLLALIK